MKYVKKIYFRNSETYNRLYQGAELLFEVKREFEYLTFTALETSTIKYIPSSVSTARYSYDKVNWNSADNVTLNLNTDDKVYFKGTITGNQSDSNYANFTMTGKISASGSIMSMHNGNQDYKTLKYDYEFYKLFNGCTSLVTAPDLPATTLTDDCYDFMFADCKSLTTTPAILPATTLTYCCYQHMFGGCSNLTTVPELPATTLSQRCYASMFEDCTSLTSAPELPATKLDYECYRYMFSGCHSLTTAPELPATTLADYCYGDMFLNCHSLTTAPDLPATTLVDNCYTGMFLYCNNLNYIKAMFTTTPSDAYTSNWVDGVASTGTFVKNKYATWNVIGVNGVPIGWTIQDYVELDYLTFTAIEPSTIQYTPSSVTTARYSYDKVNWVKADNVTLNLNTGDKVYFKGNITGEQSTSSYAHFTMTGKVASSGSIMSMQNGNSQDNSLKYKYEFYGLFQNCSSLVKAPELPATTLTERCYQNLFVGCGLTEPTALPATTLAVRCYQNLFNGCSNLTSAPELPATTMVDNCYANMFFVCSKLTTPPALPATTLDVGCYQGMFYHCTSLTTAPDLPATTLVTNCYKNMFNGCSNLNYIKALFTTTPSSSYTANWVKEVASTGTFVKNRDATWDVTGINGIPTGWTVEPKQYDVLYVSGRYNFKIPKGDGTYYVIDTKNDCEADFITNSNRTSLNEVILGSKSVGDQYEWELFFASTKLYFDLSFKNNRRLYWSFGTLTKDTVYKIGGSNGNYLGTDRALYVNGSKKASSTTKSTYNNTSDIVFFGENNTSVNIGNIKIYEKTGLVYNIVAIMYNGEVAFYDKVNKRFMEITSTPPSQYVTTIATGEKIII